MSTAITTEFELEPPEPERARARQREQSVPRPPVPFGVRLAVRHVALPAVVALSAVLNFHRLAQNGYANVFYAAGVKSMLHSLHNFLFVSFDPGGLVSVDKPPVALWVQVASAKLFGFSPMHLLAPEALAGVASVALLYVVLAKRFGILAALAGSLTLAVFPSFVAVSRENGVDPVLLLLLSCACAIAVRACESGRLRTLIAAGVLVGLAFNTKTLAAYLAVPGIALAYLVCAPVPVRRRIVQLALAGVAMLIVSFAWILFVDSVPASKRPYVGSSTNNSELGLTFGYNGLGRVEGQEGGPNSVIVKPGAYVPGKQEQRSDAASAAARLHGALGIAAVPDEHVPKGAPAGPPIVVKGRAKEPTPFGPSPRLLRLFGSGLGDQAGWMLPFALFGLLASVALALAQLRDWRNGARPRAASTGERPRTPPPPAPDRDASAPVPGLPADQRSRLAFTLAFGGWFTVELVVLSLSKGIIHPYYVSGLAPGTGAMAGVGVAAFVKLARRPSRALGRPLGLALAAAALATTVLAQVVLMQREHYMLWFVPLLVAGAAVGMLALAALRRLAAPAVACTLALLLITPGAYAASTWLAPVEGTFPVAGPKSFPGPGGYGVDARDLAINRALVRWVSTHDPGTRWELLTVASDTAAPMMLMGLNAGALGGYSGTDPALNGPRLARYVARHEARYVMLGGGYSLRGGNAATKAVLRACRELPPWEWHSPVAYPFGLVLFDCAGRAKQLAAS
ncbi:MAG TPA: glycosyltransferase family 39 protein [Solirubrobacteraceae bacterium]|jgi:4-amino-4-deoxy-L-arabinose transferase-like glycosyltransferase|nr:glycosyltransferase family 39 protein [Solirubrobacteraceae bacterium]